MLFYLADSYLIKQIHRFPHCPEVVVWKRAEFKPCGVCGLGKVVAAERGIIAIGGEPLKPPHKLRLYRCLRRDIQKSRAVGRKEPFLPSGGESCDVERVQINGEVAGALNSIHAQKRPTPAGDVGKSAQIVAEAIKKAHPRDGDDTGIGTVKQGFVRLGQHLKFYPPAPCRLLPRVEIRRELIGRQKNRSPRRNFQPVGGDIYPEGCVYHQRNSLGGSPHKCGDFLPYLGDYAERFGIVADSLAPIAPEKPLHLGNRHLRQNPG